MFCNRSLQFVNEFITAFLAAGAEEDLTNSINTAYAKSLSDYHGWVVRGAFAVRFLCFVSAVLLALSRSCIVLVCAPYSSRPVLN
jgi:hypothetical protein